MELSRVDAAWRTGAATARALLTEAKSQRDISPVKIWQELIDNESSCGHFSAFKSSITVA